MKYFQTKRLSTEGGTSVQECVDRILKKLLTRAVGSLYNYMGIENKKGRNKNLLFFLQRCAKLSKV